MFFGNLLKVAFSAEGGAVGIVATIIGIAISNYLSSPPPATNLPVINPPKNGTNNGNTTGSLLDCRNRPRYPQPVSSSGAKTGIGAYALCCTRPYFGTTDDVNAAAVQNGSCILVAGSFDINNNGIDDSKEQNSGNGGGTSTGGGTTGGNGNLCAAFAGYTNLQQYADSSKFNNICCSGDFTAALNRVGQDVVPAMDGVPAHLLTYDDVVKQYCVIPSTLPANKLCMKDNDGSPYTYCDGFRYPDTSP